MSGESSPYVNKLRSSKKKRKHSSKPRDPSSTRKELRASQHKFLLDRVFAFLYSVFGEGQCPKSEQDFAEHLPDGKLLCQVAQYVSRRCNLDCYDWPRLATVTPNGKSRAATQNHAKFVSFCKDIGIMAERIPSLEDVAQRRTESVIQVLLDIEDFVISQGAALDAPSQKVKQGSGYFTPTKKSGRNKNAGHIASVTLAVNSSPMVKNLAKSLTKSGMRLKDHTKDLDAENNEENQHMVDNSMMASLSRIEHQVKSSRKKKSSLCNESSKESLSMHAKAEIHLLMQKAHNLSSEDNETPPPSIQNPEHLRHSSKVSSIRKRLLDQKDKDIANLHAKNSAMQKALDKLDLIKQELEKEKRKAKSLQADLDRTRAEVIGQARAGEETAITTSELRAEVTELEKKLSVATAANAAHERQIARLSSEVKNLEARNVDLESAATDTEETMRRTAEQEKNNLESRVRELEHELSSSTSDLKSTKTECQSLQARLTAEEAKVEDMEAKMNRMRITLDGVEDRETSLKETIKELEAELEAQESVVDAAESREQEAAKAVESAKQEKEETRAWVMKSAKQLRERISAVRDASACVKEEMRSQCSSMSVDFAKLGESVVGAISELTGLKDDAVAQYRREQRSRQKVFNELQRRRGNIRVLCRSRPNKDLARKEKEEGAYGTTVFHSDTELTVRAQGSRSKNARSYRNFEFDHVFHPSANQEEVYYEVSPMVQSAMDGFHSCIFAYGQTGSGKTYTMQGPPSDPGVYARSLEELFRVVEQRNQTHKYSMTVSMVEIYNETIRDLLVGKKGEAWPGGEVHEIECANEEAKVKSQRNAKADKQRGMSKERRTRKHGTGAPTSAAGSSGTRYGSGGGLAIHHGENGNEVVGATHLPVSCPGDIEHIMKRGQRNRSVGSTSMNEHSSRSHCLLIIKISGLEIDKQMNIHGKLVMVDLAGSERLSKTEASGARLKEAQNINKSLSALGNVINALKTKAGHVPFRDSKLTHLLQDSLSRDNKALMITQISPTESDAGETMCTLQFASRVRGVELGAAKSHKSSKANRAEEMQLKRDLSRMESEHAALSAVVARQTSELAAAEASLADLAAQQATKITGFSSRVSELESKLKAADEEVATHKRKVFALKKDLATAEANSETEKNSLKKLMLNKSQSDKERETLSKKLEATNAKLKRAVKALDLAERKNTKEVAGNSSELTKLKSSMKSYQQDIKDLKSRLAEREEQLQASEAKRKALQQRQSSLIAKHNASLKKKEKMHQAEIRRFSNTQRVMKREQEDQRQELLSLQHQKRVDKVRKSRLSNQNRRRNKAEDAENNNSALPDTPILPEADESYLDNSSIESMDMSLDGATTKMHDITEICAVRDSPQNPSAPSISIAAPPTPLQTRTNTPRSSRKASRGKKTPQSTKRAEVSSLSRSIKHTDRQANSPKAGILKKSSFAGPMDRAEQLKQWKAEKAAKAAKNVQNKSKSIGSRKSVAFDPSVTQNSSMRNSAKKQPLTPGRKSSFSKTRASLAGSKSRMSISGKGGSLRMKLSTLGTAVRVRSNSSKGLSSAVKTKKSLGNAVRNATKTSTRSMSGWH